MTKGRELQDLIRLARETTRKPRSHIEARVRELAGRAGDLEWLQRQFDRAQEESRRFRGTDWWAVAQEFEQCQIKDALRLVSA